MPRLFWTFLALIPLAFAPAALSQDKEKDKDKKDKAPLKVTYYGQSFYTVTTGKGTVVAFDPHGLIEYWSKFRDVEIRADLVLISHEHSEHNFIGALANKDTAKVLRGLTGPGLKANWVPIDETFKDVNVKSVGLFHDDAEGLRYGKSAAFLIEVDGWRIVHLGDLGHELTARQLRQIGPVDVVMIPVGGIYTLNGSDAKRVVEQLKPKEYVFPMHYGTKAFEDLLPPDEFFEDQPKKQVLKSDDNHLFLNRDPDRPRPLLVQLHYAPREVREEVKDKDKDKKEIKK